MELSIEVLAAFALAHLVAAASPGPNFFLVSRIAMSTSRLHGLFAALGILASTAIWSVSAALGLDLILDTYPALGSALRYMGAVYLIWLGIGLVRNALRPEVAASDTRLRNGLSVGGAFGRGLVVNMTNPKTIAYYSSIFALLVSDGASGAAMAEIVATALIVSAAWWCSVAFFFSKPAVARLFMRLRRIIEFVAGSAFVLFGARMTLQ